MSEVKFEAVEVRLSDPIVRDAIFAAWGGFCAYCREKADQTDHVFPVSAGGGDTLGNIVAACARCNMRKGDILLQRGFMEIILARAVSKAPGVCARIEALREIAARPSDWRKSVAIQGRKHPAKHTSSMTFRVEEDLQAEFIAVCKENDVSAAQVLRGIMRDYLESTTCDNLTVVCEVEQKGS